MQHVGEPGTPEMKTDDKPSGGLSPVKAFFALLALLVAIGGLFLLTRPTDESEPGPASRSDNFALTDTEAIERFKELDGLQIRALRQRDETLLGRVYTSDSPLMSSVTKSIRTLKRESVFDRSQDETRSLLVIENGQDEIRLRQEVVVMPKFVDESGRDVTINSRTELQTVEVTLRRDLDQWLIHDAVITETEKASS
jgi:RNase P/RNase MRP subunit p29